MQKKNCTLFVFTFLLALLAGVPLMAQKKPALKLPQLNVPNHRFYFSYPVQQPPVIDGKLEKEFWSKLPRAKYFTVNDYKNSSATRQTVFQIGYDDTYLYLGAIMFEPFPARIKDGKDVPEQERDCLSFIFSKTYDKKGNPADQPYIMIHYYAGGTSAAVRNALPEKKIVPVAITKDWQYAYSKDSMHWYVEARIPLADLGFSPKDEYVFINASRYLTTGPKGEKESMWSEKLNSRLGIHSLAYFLFMEKRGNTSYDTLRINASPRYKHHKYVMEPIGRRQGIYLTAFQQFGKDPNWKNVDIAADKIKNFFDKNNKRGINALIVDEGDEYYMEYLRAFDTVYKPTPPRALQLPAKDCVIKSVKLNEELIPCKNGSWLLPMESGISKLEITAEAAGANPGLRIALAGSPETAEHVFAFNEKGAKVSLANTNGKLWSGKEKTLTFRQNLVWHREYCNHRYAFIHPNVQKWGVSPGETTHFIHRLFNVNETKKKADYTLIMEIPEGFQRINDSMGYSVFHHYPTKDIKEEKVTINGEKYLRYTYKWTLPAKLERNLPFYTHYISIKHDSYKFAKGKNPVIRFRRIIDGNTVDIVNTVPLYELPPINGGKMKHFCFPQYHNFMGGFVSDEQWEAMLSNCANAGMGSFYLAIGTPNPDNPRILKINKLKNKYGNKNFVWMHWNLPLWGSGQLKTATRRLVDKTSDLHAVFFHKNDRGPLAHMNIMYCLTKAVGKYREPFFNALVEDYKWAMAKTGTKNIFINDENKPHMSDKKWKNSYCFCNDCKQEFLKFIKVAPYDITNQEIADKYEKQWGDFWRYMHKFKLLTMVRDAIKKAGGTFAYYHTSTDRSALKYAKGLYDTQFVTIPGCNIYTGSNYQPTVDRDLKAVRDITGERNLIGQYRTYVPDTFYSSDGVYYHPEEMKHQLLRLAASLQCGAISECGVYFSAGSLYYAGEATRIIAEYEDIFYNGTRNDALAGGTFQYPDKLVLTKGKERLVLLFNEKETPVKGELLNLNLAKGQKAKIVGQKKWIADPAKMQLTIPAKEVIVIYIK